MLRLCLPLTQSAGLQVNSSVRLGAALAEAWRGPTTPSTDRVGHRLFQAGGQRTSAGPPRHSGRHTGMRPAGTILPDHQELTAGSDPGLPLPREALISPCAARTDHACRRRSLGVAAVLYDRAPLAFSAEPRRLWSGSAKPHSLRQRCLSPTFLLLRVPTTRRWLLGHFEYRTGAAILAPPRQGRSGRVPAALRDTPRPIALGGTLEIRGLVDRINLCWTSRFYLEAERDTISDAAHGSARLLAVCAPLRGIFRSNPKGPRPRPARSVRRGRIDTLVEPGSLTTTPQAATLLEFTQSASSPPGRGLTLSDWRRRPSTRLSGCRYAGLVHVVGKIDL